MFQSSINKQKQYKSRNLQESDNSLNSFTRMGVVDNRPIQQSQAQIKKIIQRNIYPANSGLEQGLHDYFIKKIDSMLPIMATSHDTVVHNTAMWFDKYPDDLCVHTPTYDAENVAKMKAGKDGYMAIFSDESIPYKDPRNKSLHYDPTLNNIKCVPIAQKGWSDDKVHLISTMADEGYEDIAKALVHETLHHTDNLHKIEAVEDFRKNPSEKSLEMAFYKFKTEFNAFYHGKWGEIVTADDAKNYIIRNLNYSEIRNPYVDKSPFRGSTFDQVVDRYVATLPTFINYSYLDKFENAGKQDEDELEERAFPLATGFNPLVSPILDDLYDILDDIQEKSDVNLYDCGDIEQVMQELSPTELSFVKVSTDYKLKVLACYQAIPDTPPIKRQKIVQAWRLTNFFPHF